MYENYDYRFKVKGRRIFVPTPKSVKIGRHLHEIILGRWKAPEYFYHFSPGGHVAAVQAHLQSSLFVRLDISSFYHSISRAKVHRALRGLGYPNLVALRHARFSTVNQDPLRKKYFSLPFGFVQSPALASVVLDQSLLGRAIADLVAGGMPVSVYMDDIVLSGHDANVLAKARDHLKQAAATSGFVFQSAKSAGPDPTIEVFNLELGHEHLRITLARMAEFAGEIATGTDPKIQGILSYVKTVNEVQEGELRALLADPGRTAL